MTDAKPAARVAVILDSDPFFREFQNFLLQGNGFAVRMAMKPEEFTASWIRAHDPDIIVTEVLLPGRSGLDLTRELRQGPGVRGAIIVYSVLRVEQRALAAGADRFLLKPLLRESYLDALQDATKQIS